MKQITEGKNDYILAEETKRFPNLHFGFVPALIVVILPKCPLCLMAYASILGTFGLTPLLYSFWILPVTIFFSALTIILLYYKAKRSGKYLLFLLSLIAPFMMYDRQILSRIELADFHRSGNASNLVGPAFSFRKTAIRLLRAVAATLKNDEQTILM